MSYQLTTHTKILTRCTAYSVVRLKVIFFRAGEALLVFCFPSTFLGGLLDSCFCFFSDFFWWFCSPLSTFFLVGIFLKFEVQIMGARECYCFIFWNLNLREVHNMCCLVFSKMWDYRSLKIINYMLASEKEFLIKKMMLTKWSRFRSSQTLTITVQLS